MTKFINRLDNNTIAYNQLIGKKEGIVFLSGFNSDMQGKKALYLEKWAEENNHSFLRFDYSGHGQSSGSIDKTCFSDWYQDAEYLINKLTKDKQILVGSSMGAWIMLMLAKRIPQKISAIVGLAPAPDFPKLLIWDKMTGNEKRKLVKNRKTSIKYEDGSKNDFSYKLIMLETETPVEKIQQAAKLDDFDLEKFKKMQNISTNIIEKPPENPISQENYQVPEETSFGNTIVSGNF